MAQNGSETTTWVAFDHIFYLFGKHLMTKPLAGLQNEGALAPLRATCTVPQAQGAGDS